MPTARFPRPDCLPAVRFFTTLLAVLSGLMLSVSLPAPTVARAAELATALRRPIALQLSPNERTLIVLNQRSGSLSLIDTELGDVREEIPIGKKPADLAASADRRLLLVPDETAHELLLLDVTEDSGNPARVTLRQRLPVSPYPVSVTLTRDGRQAFVASLWSRRLTEIALPQSPKEQAHIVRTIDLTIAPRKQLLVQNDQTLLVADSFAGKLAVIETKTGTLKGLREFPAHNIRGMGLNADGTMLVLAHQMLNELAHTIRNDVHWGLLMSNDLRWLKLDQMVSGGKDLYAGGHMHPLGHAGSATADPAGLAFAPDGTVIVTLAGVGEVAIGKESDFSLYRTPVGKRPVAVVVTRDSRRAYVANMFGDDISLVDLEEREKKTDISLGPGVELTLADRGELLFYDGNMSHDGWMSCHSCHTDGHTNGQLNDNFSDKSFGAPKRVLTLLGRADTGPFAWNASSPDLPSQIRKSLTITMQTPKEPNDGTLAALAAYVATLESPPSIDRLRGNVDEPAIRRGQAMFESRQCNRCHAPPTYTTPRTYDVGLKDQQGNTEFNPPSLRGVAQRAPYFHDNRAATLEDVFREHGHQLDGDLSSAELADLIAFLRSL